MTEFKDYELESVCDRLSSGKNIKAEKVLDSAQYPVFGGNGHRGYSEEKNFEGECAVIGRQGAYCGNVKYFSGEAYMTEHAVVVQANANNNTRYLAYLLSTMQLGRLSGQSAQPGLSVKVLGKQIINLPNKSIQDKIVSILGLLDKKIAINEAINRNLEEQAQAIYRKMFVESGNRNTCRTDEFFDITIGKTPPRKEEEWFSYNPDDCVWISIADMGNCGTFINNSTEYLTRAAVDKYNVKVVPHNTVILSFKLTVGRIAITVGETTTNEAIAHFNTMRENIVEYLYCYLKSFDFRSLGSTSSIGTAVNSKTIKAMDFVVPDENELDEFYKIANPMFEQIKKNQFENQYLTEMRDSLLPKLMSGELDVSELDI